MEELPKEIKEKINSIENTLQEILKWTRFANLSKLKEILEKELETDQKKLAYESTDGVNGIKEVAAGSGAPQDTVYGWWQKWSRLGLVIESATRKGRMVKIVSLDDVGIKIPKKAKSSPAQTASPPEQGPSTQPTQTETASA